MEKSVLFTFDCDLTLVDMDSDVAVAELGEPLPQKIKDLCDGHYWTEYMNAVFSHLNDQGVTLDRISERINSIPLVKGMTEVLTSLHRNSKVQMVVISDANDFGITKILGRLLGESAASKIPILANKGHITKAGYLQISPFQTQWNCDFCPRNLCKGAALSSFIARKGPFEQVVYVGDGKNDICPVIRLTKSDKVFVRRGFALERIIKEGESRGKKVMIEAQVLYWNDGIDILTLHCQKNN